MQKTGMFIVLEGGEGSGKSTQIEKLRAHLPVAYPERELLFTREPGGSPLAEEIRTLMKSDMTKDASGRTMLGLIMASRSDHIEKTIIPALAEGKIVVCDRYLPSTYAYQIAAQESPELEEIFWAFSNRMLTPDLVLFLDLESEKAKQRVDARAENKSHFDAREPAFYDRIRAGYKRYFSVAQVNSATIDADQTVEAVWSEVEKAVASLLTTPR